MTGVDGSFKQDLMRLRQTTRVLICMLQNQPVSRPAQSAKFDQCCLLFPEGISGPLLRTLPTASEE